MTYQTALGVILMGLAISGFSTWYMWCVYTMFFKCQSPREFFSVRYSTSGPFMFVNIIALVLASAWVLMKLAN